ncbi:MAG: terminase family protein [Bacteroidales bacterium]|nr:terminase family protein [Bacteroidales bacterium]
MSDDRERNRRVYTTEKINQLIKDRAEGYDIDYSPFFERDLELRAPNIPFKMTEWEYEEYMKCYNNPLYFIEHYCKFRTDKGDSLVELRDYQREIISLSTEEVFEEELQLFAPKYHNIIWLSARQSGKTTTLCSILTYKMVMNHSFTAAVMANKSDTATELVQKITNIIKGLPYFLKPGCINFGKTGLKFDNGSQLISSATTNTASIGFTIHFMILDEFAHIPDNIVNNFWRSVYPTLSSSKISQCMIISTPNGTTNKFFEIYTSAINGTSSWRALRTDYWQVPGHGEEWAKRMRADFGEEEFAQEFELQFNKNSKMLMKAEAADYIDRMIRPFVPKRIHTTNQYLNDEHLLWDPSFDPNNINPSDKFLFLVDLADGGAEVDEKFTSKKKEPDFNSINIFRVRINSLANIRRFSNTSCKIADCFRFEQVGRYSCNTEDEIQTARVCSALCYNLFHDDERDSVRVAVEMNFNGKAFLEEFKRHQLYSGATIVRTYHTKPIPGEKQRKRYGIRTKQDKESYCIKGNKMLSKHRTIIHCKDTFEQMKAFGYVRGRLKGIAMHDDLSMPVFNHIPRMLDESSFVSWLQEYLYFYEDKSVTYAINALIQKWAMDNPDMSDDDFMELYGLNEKQGYNPNAPQLSPYASQQTLSPYANPAQLSPYANQGNGLSPYSSEGMFGGMNPYSEGLPV